VRVWEGLQSFDSRWPTRHRRRRVILPWHTSPPPPLPPTHGHCDPYHYRRTPLSSFTPAVAGFQRKVEELEDTLTEVRARVVELETEVAAVTERAAAEIESRTSGASNKIREVELELKDARAKVEKSESERREALEVARQRGESVAALEKELRVVTAKVEKSGELERIQKET
jgi:chromosome segregation ATPase